MTDPRRTAQQDRRLQEQIQTLFGERGNPADKAVRLKDLLDPSNPAFTAVNALMQQGAQAVVQQEVAVSNASINKQLKAGKQAAEAAAQKAEQAQTNLNRVSETVSAAIEGLSGDVTTLETSIRSDLNRTTPPVTFVAGAAAWTSGHQGVPEDMGAPHASWSFADDKAEQDLPSSTTGAPLYTKGVVPVVDGDAVRITVALRVTGSGDGIGGARLLFSWMDADFSAGAITASELTLDAAEGEWITVSGTVEAPSDAVWVRGGIEIDGTAYGVGSSVELRIVKVENTVSIPDVIASARSTFYTKAETGAAIAAGVEEFNASVAGGLTAKVTSTSAALASLSGAVASFSVLVSAGSEYNVAGIEVAAWDGDGTVSGTAVRLLGDAVHVPGSLSAASLTITDGSGELVPNNNFFNGDLRGWTQFEGASAYVVAKASGLPGVNTANALYALCAPAGSGAQSFVSRPLQAAPGQRFVMSVEAASGAATSGASAWLRVHFHDQYGNYLAGYGALASGDSATWQSASNVIEAPAGTAYMLVLITMTPSASQPVYGTNLSVFRQRSGAILITPNSITGAQLIATEAIVTASAQIANGLIGSAHIGYAQINAGHIGAAQINSAHIGAAQVGTAHIADLSVNTLKIAGNAVTIPVSGAAGGNAHSIGVSLDVASNVYIIATFESVEVSVAHSLRIYIDGVEVKRASGSAYLDNPSSWLRVPLSVVSINSMSAGYHVISASASNASTTTIFAIVVKR